MEDIYLDGIVSLTNFISSGYVNRNIHFQLEDLSFTAMAGVSATAGLGIFEAISRIVRFNVVKSFQMNQCSFSRTQFSAFLDILSSGAAKSNDFEFRLANSRVDESILKELTTHPLLHHITTLDLYASKIPYSSLVTLLYKVVNLNTLKKLVLDRMLLTSTVVNGLCNWLCSETCSLVALSVEECGLSPRNDGEMFITRSSDFSSLQILNLAGNQFHQYDTSTDYLALIHNTTLRQFSIEKMPLNTETAFFIGFVIRVSQIMSINLRECRIGNEELAAFLAGFQYFDIMLNPPPIIQQSPFPPPLHSNGSPDELQCTETYDNEKGIVDTFCENTWQSFVDRFETAMAAGDLSTTPHLLDLNLSYNRFRDVTLLMPLVTNRNVGLSCLSLAGNR